MARPQDPKLGDSFDVAEQMKKSRERILFGRRKVRPLWHGNRKLEQEWDARYMQFMEGGPPSLFRGD